MRLLLIVSVALLAGCAAQGDLPSPTGPLLVMNPSRWSYTGANVVPQVQQVRP